MVGPITALMGHPFAVVLRMSLRGLALDFMDDALVRAANVSGNATAMHVAVDRPDEALGDSLAPSALALQSSGGDPVHIIAQYGWIVSIVAVVVHLLFAFWYKSSITDKRAAWHGCPQGSSLQTPGAGVAKWKYDTFSCCDNTTYCLFGWCCLGCRIGDTYAASNVGPGCGPGYWTFVIALELVLLCGIIEGLQIVAMIGFAVWMATRRKELRRTLGDPNSDADFFMDCLCYWCCSCCMAIQEARQVDEATGTEVECCLKLKHTASPTVVGQPVLAAPLAPQPVVS